ncbi:hypothetical protein IHE45_04G011100, partial [Dioscorea alata]
NATIERKKTVLEAAIDEDSSQNDPTIENNIHNFDKQLSKSSSASSSSSSQSSSSEDGDFFQLELGKPLPTEQEPGLITGLEPIQSPPMQAMSRSDGNPDPNRIPSSVFERTKSTTPMEWSVASNESLFSIHLGNNSFSRDHVLLLKSGDLTNFYVGNLDAFPPPNSAMMPIPAPASIDLALALEQNDNVAQAMNAEAMKDVMRANAEQHSGSRKPLVELPPLGNSLSRNSDASVQSFRSFAFPILTVEGRNASVRAVESEQIEREQQQTTETPKETPTAAAAPAQSRWFPCFSCAFCS